MKTFLLLLIRVINVPKLKNEIKTVRNLNDFTVFLVILHKMQIVDYKPCDKVITVFSKCRDETPLPIVFITNIEQYVIPLSFVD